MNFTDIASRLDFIRQAEQLKHTLRSGYTSAGRRESSAEHTWRLCLLAMVFEDTLPELDFGKILKMCVLHDLGEAINGDIPAVDQQTGTDKSVQERRDLLQLMQPLPPKRRDEFLSLWEEYESASSPEARAVKALDKIETIMQHNQGANPADFDYGFNLSYGQQYTSTAPLFSEIRAIIDQETERKVIKRATTQPGKDNSGPTV